MFSFECVMWIPQFFVKNLWQKYVFHYQYQSSFWRNTCEHRQSYTKTDQQSFWVPRGLHQALYSIIVTITIALVRQCLWDSAYWSICMKNRSNKAVEHSRWSYHSFISCFSFSLVFLFWGLKHETWCLMGTHRVNCICQLKFCCV